MTEREREKMLDKQNGEEAGFFLTLDPILSSLGTRNPPLFIMGRRWTFCL